MKRIIFFLITCCLFIGCKPNEETLSGGSNFDRQQMLVYYADSLIIPAYQNFEAAVNVFQAQVTALYEGTNDQQLRLTQARNQWRTVALAFQQINAYNFGPAGEQGTIKSLSEEIGTFPVNAAAIEGRIATNNTNFTDFARDTRGIFAIEYLLYSSDSFPNSSRLGYLTALTKHLTDKMNSVLTQWRNSYRNEFIKQTGTDAGSSSSLLYNEFVKSYESIKNYKVGLPLGKRPGQTQTAPNLVEAYYSGISVELINKHLQTIELIWRSGFKLYLNTIPGGSTLIENTERQLLLVYQAINALSRQVPLDEQIITNAAQVEQLYIELQKQTRYFKSDLSSLLGISITFSSGDGD
jgi:predicted lipoprotein